MTQRIMSLGIVAAAVGVFLAAPWLTSVDAGQQPVQIDADDIGGVVTGPSGPEGGVWVIAETTDLPTKFSKTVVTDDAGRYVIPDLPDATYDVWVRGYGLVDSPKNQVTTGTTQNLTAVVAPDAQAAAHYYPAAYWFSLIEMPAADQFPGTGPEGNGISPNIESQAEWISQVKSTNCMQCHQLGNKATREIPTDLGEFDSLEAAWERRLQSGQAGGFMNFGLNNIGRRAALTMFADWTDRIVTGEVPEAPPRPQGIERNVVISQWDWADPKAYLHDEISTDKRNPRLHANGPIYGALEASADYVPVLDPVNHRASQIPLPVRDPETPGQGPPAMPSAYWGDEAIWDSQANAHNPMLDQDGRLWLTSRIRPSENPTFCRAGSSHPSAQLFPTERAGRHLAVWDPDAEEMTLIDTCYSTHHLVFAEDEENTLWTSGGGPVIGWLNTNMFLETRDEQRSQGWAPLILDTNGNGQQDAWVEPDEAVDPSKDTRIGGGYYGVAVNPVDGAVWGSALGFPGAVLRFDPDTLLTEIYELPYDNPRAAVQGYSPRGMDIDRHGIVWAALASGHMGRFDRSQCTGPLNGPTATGQHCPEGWTFYEEPVPQLKGLSESGSAEASYFTWVDQFDTFGLGENVPINTGNGAEALLALVDEEWVVMRVPYPLGFYTKWVDGRFDDPNTGWKGKGLWATYGTRTPFHLETGKGTTSKVVHFQLRPDPLGK